MRTYKKALLAIPAALLLAASPLIASAERSTTCSIDPIDLHDPAMARMVFQHWLSIQELYGLIDGEPVTFRADERTRIQRRDGTELERGDLRQGDDVAVLFDAGGRVALTVIKL